jgi:hypothetical protein
LFLLESQFDFEAFLELPLRQMKIIPSSVLRFGVRLNESLGIFVLVIPIQKKACFHRYLASKPSLLGVKRGDHDPARVECELADILSRNFGWSFGCNILLGD